MLHQIGVGALGPVFRTYEPTRDRLVAVKVFRSTSPPKQARALADELARAADAGLFHPSIVEPVAAGIEGTVAYRAEEYVAAESLDVAMRHYAPATVDKVLPFITQLASAHRFCQGGGRWARRASPAATFSSRRTRLARPVSASSTRWIASSCARRCGGRTVRPSGSPASAWSTPADVFSLAVIAFELLTGRRPSGLGDDMGSLTVRRSAITPTRFAPCSRAPCTRSPLARYATAQAFSAALAQAAGVPETTVSLVDAIAQSANHATGANPRFAIAPPEAPREPVARRLTIASADAGIRPISRP